MANLIVGSLACSRLIIMTEWWSSLPSWRQVLISAAILAALIALFVLFFDLIEQ